MEEEAAAPPAKHTFAKRLHFPDWQPFLSASGLPAHRQQSFAITIRWYLSWAKRARVPVDFDSARDFMAQVQREKRPMGDGSSEFGVPSSEIGNRRLQFEGDGRLRLVSGGQRGWIQFYWSRFAGRGR